MEAEGRTTLQEEGRWLGKDAESRKRVEAERKEEDTESRKRGDGVLNERRHEESRRIEAREHEQKEEEKKEPKDSPEGLVLPGEDPEA
ncbi:hypothetical protein NDU88_009062 [Pleurodeles waltl]|uniref:Uncharacterized protein n=1 Tax=Pleurodeles waltl TaxID=8319 RepID=A0AAV7PTX8_PLEWA|nr:hypothetical protein NDU88_009062 [Pleurodeles waltl]